MVKFEKHVGERVAVVLSADRGTCYAVAFGYEDRDGFNCTRPTRWFKTLAGAQRAAREYASRP